MAKFVRVTEAPESLEKDCIVIEAPNFKAEIKRCDAKKPRSGLLSPNYLREICAAVGDKYSDENFNALTSVNVSGYKGIPFSSVEDVEKVVNTILNKGCPELFDNYVDYHIKQRPHGTKLIYFLGDFVHTGSFTRNGIDEVAAKDVDVYLGLKEKKVVGKPAVTDKEAKSKKK